MRVEAPQGNIILAAMTNTTAGALKTVLSKLMSQSELEGDRFN